MELKDLEELFHFEQELDIPHRDRWYNKDFDKRELEEQSVKNCNIPHDSTKCRHDYNYKILFDHTAVAVCSKCKKRVKA